MTNEELTPRQHELLRLIVAWRRDNGATTPVKRQWIEDRLHLEKNSVSGLKRKLIDKGYLEENRFDFLLTPQAQDYLTNSNTPLSLRILTSLQLPIFGQVRAGKTKQDEIRVELTDLTGENPSTISIPDIKVDKGLPIFLLQVMGKSMEHENIYEGDYVIVESYAEDQMPRQGEMIVTKYLAARDEPEFEALGYVSDELLDGPTLKIFVEKANDERPYRLSWQKEVDKNPDTIQTKVIRPIGRVIGVYRSLLERR